MAHFAEIFLGRNHRPNHILKTVQQNSSGRKNFRST